MSTPTLALDMEFYAPNGGSIIADAFTRLALIFSDTQYALAFPIIAAISLMFAAIQNFLIAPLTAGKSGNPLTLFAPLAIGTVFYLAAIVPTGTLHIYDPVKNSTHSVSGIPISIVLLAGMTNLLEKNMIAITETATARPYSEFAGGINLELFINAASEPFIEKKKILTKDLKNYYKMCGTFDLSISKDYNFEYMMSNVPSLYNLLAEWIHPSVWVDTSQGNMTCTKAWQTVISPALAIHVFEKDAANICAKSGFDPLKIVELQQCKKRIGELSQIHGLPTVTANNYIRDSFIAHTILRQINLSKDPMQAQQTLMRRQLALQGLGAINTTEDTMPNLKAVMTAIILGIIPFLFLFLLTPLWSKALKFIAGGILWLSTWGIMMAVSHTATMDQAMLILSELSSNKMGLDAFLLASTDGVKAFMLFGKMMSNSLMMSTAIAVAIYSFGSYALTSMAAGQAANMQHMGENAAQQALTPEGRAGVRNGLISGTASDAGVQYESLNSGRTGTEPLQDKALGAKANEVASGKTTDINKQGIKGVVETLDEQSTAVAAQKNMSRVGNGNLEKGAGIITHDAAAQRIGSLLHNQNIAKMIGQEPTEENLRNIRENQANNNGAYAMTGHQIVNSALFNELSPAQQDFINSNKATIFSVNPTFGEDGTLNDSAAIRSGINVQNLNNLNDEQKNSSAFTDSIDSGTHITPQAMMKGLEYINNPNENDPAGKAAAGQLTKMINNSTSDLQAHREIQNKLAGVWKSIGININEDEIGSKTFSASANAGINTAKMLGGVFESMTGIKLGIEGSITGSETNRGTATTQVFHQIADEFLKLADGDATKLAGFHADFQQQLINLRGDIAGDTANEMTNKGETPKGETNKADTGTGNADTGINFRKDMMNRF
jgi:hypothetical protein